MSLLSFIPPAPTLHDPLLQGAAIALLAAAVVALSAVRGVMRARRAVGATRPRSRALPASGPPTTLDAALARLFAAAPRDGETPVGAAGLIADGRDAFAARALSAASAGRSLDLMYYAWGADAFGRLLAGYVWDAAERGVRVRMLVDDINAEGVDAMLTALDSHANISVRVHNPIWARGGAARLAEMLLRFARINHRMHNKAWIADGRLALVGGRNIEARYFDADEAVNFRDLDMLALGPVVGEAERVFDLFWNHDSAWPFAAVTREPPDAVDAALRDLLSARDAHAARAYVAACPPTLDAFLAARDCLRWPQRLSIASDPPGKWRASRVRKRWIVTRLWALARACQSEALIVSPYFVPGRRLTGLLRTLALRKRARVEVVTNSLAANDVAAVHGGYMRYRRRLLRGRVALFEIRDANPGEEEGSVFGSSNASLHTKAALFDRRHGFVGSFNMDPRSARVNSEMGVFFDDAALAADLRAEIDRLKSPALSYRVRLEGRALVWEDAATDPPTRLHDEPNSTLKQRMIARIAGWLPIEKEL